MRNWYHQLWLQAALAGVALAQPLQIANLERAEPVDFQKEILPFLKKNCLACHNETKAKADLVLETPEAILKGGDTQPSVVPGDAMASLVFTTAAHIEDPIMPPDNNKSEAKNLTPEQLALFRLWIDQGAKSSEGMIAAAPEDWQANPQNEIYAIAVSPDSRFVATARGHGIQIYDLGLNQMVASLTDPALEGQAHRDYVHDLAFNLDGTLASGGFRIIKVWNRGPLLPVKVEKVEAAEPVALTDEQKALFKDLDLTPQITKTIEEVRRKEAMAKRLSDLYGKEIPGREDAWKKEGEATDQAAKEIPKARIEETTKAAQLIEKRQALEIAESLKKPEETITKLKGELDALETELETAKRNLRLATRNRDQAAKLTGEAARLLAETKAHKASADADMEALKGIREGLEKQKAEFKGEVVAIAKLNGDKVLALALKSGEVLLYGIETKQHLETIPVGEAIVGLAIEKGDLATITASKQKLTWNTSRPWKLASQIGDGADATILEDRVTALAYSPDGSLLVSGTGVPSRSGIVQFWDAATGDQLAMNDEAHTDTITDITFSPDGDRIVTGSTDQFVKVFSAETADHEMSFEAHTGHVLGVDWSQDGRLIASCSADTEVKLWSLETGEQLTTHKGWKKEVTSVEFLSMADQRVLTSSGDATLKIDTGAISGSSGFLHTATVSPDEKWIFAGGEDGVLRIWTASDRKLAQSFEPRKETTAQATGD